MKNLIILSLIFLFSSCSKEQSKSKVKLTFSQAKSSSPNSSDRWQPGDFEMTAQIDCLGIVVTNPRNIRGSCSMDNNRVFSVSHFAGTVARPAPGQSSEIEIEVDSAANQEIRIIAFNNPSIMSGVECPFLNNPDPVVLDQLQRPRAINVGRFDLLEPEVDLNISITDIMVSDESDQFERCAGEAFDDFSLCQEDGSEVSFDQYGTGQEDSPHIICTADQLVDLRNQISSGAFSSTNKHIKLEADIDLMPEPNLQIGTGSYPFEGVFDGANHTISNWTYDDMTLNIEPIGLFHTLFGATVKNLTILNPSIDVNKLVDIESVGVLAGSSIDAIIDNIEIRNSSINLTSSGSIQEIGTLLGTAHDLQLTNTRVRGIGNPNVFIDSGNDVRQIGGMIGRISDSTMISNLLIGTIANPHKIEIEANTLASEIGGFIGRAENSSLSRVFVNSSIDANVNNSMTTGLQNLGGAIGLYQGGIPGLEVSEIASHVDLKFSENSKTQQVGGIIGQIVSLGQLMDFTLHDSYSAGGSTSLLNSPNHTLSNVGGIVGRTDLLMNQGNIRIERTHTNLDLGFLSNTNLDNIGGILGSSTPSTSGTLTLEDNLFAGPRIGNNSNSANINIDNGTIMGGMDRPSTSLSSNHFITDSSHLSNPDCDNCNVDGSPGTGASINDYYNNSVIEPFSTWLFTPMGGPWRLDPIRLPRLNLLFN